MTRVRYDEAAVTAFAAELGSGRPLVLLRALGPDGTDHPSGSGTGGAGAVGVSDVAGPAGGGATAAPHAAEAAASDLVSRLGAGRVKTTSVAPTAVVTAAVGAALSGLRPLVELHAGGASQGFTVERVVAELAAAMQMSGGAATGAGAGGSAAAGAVTLRLVTGSAPGEAAPPVAGAAAAAALTSLLALPGLTVAAPATAADCYGLTRAALQAPGHIVVLEAAELAGESDELADGAGALPIGSAAVVRQGDRLTIVAARRMRAVALEAAAVLSRSGIEAEIVDPRTLAPVDDATMGQSLSRTAKLLVLQDEPLAASWGAALVARLTAGHFDLFDAPPRLVGPAGDVRFDGEPAMSVEEVVAAAFDLASY